VFAATLLLAGCKPPTDVIGSGEQLLLVQAVLDAGASEQYVSVRRTSGFATTSEISNAVVTITDPHGVEYTSTRVDQDSSDGFPVSPVVHVIPLHGFALQPGGTYRLRVAIQGGEVAGGITTIPDAAPVIRSDTIPVFERSRDTLRLAWPRISGARSYQLLVQMRYRFVTGPDTTSVYASETYRAFRDTSAAVPGTAHSIDDVDVFWRPNPSYTLAGEVIAVAVDDNYYEYYHATTDPFAGAPRSRLTGAIGVFGSVVPLSRTRIKQIR
jgi:uncharacterized protein DUF4249